MLSVIFDFSTQTINTCEFILYLLYLSWLFAKKVSYEIKILFNLDHIRNEYKNDKIYKNSPNFNCTNLADVKNVSLSEG